MALVAHNLDNARFMGQLDTKGFHGLTDMDDVTDFSLKLRSEYVVP